MALKTVVFSQGENQEKFHQDKTSSRAGGDQLAFLPIPRKVPSLLTWEDGPTFDFGLTKVGPSRYFDPSVQGLELELELELQHSEGPTTLRQQGGDRSDSFGSDEQKRNSM